MKIVFISDTHGHHERVFIPPCDVLVSCGDYSNHGTLAEVGRFHSWLDRQRAQHIISVQGNHELGVEKNFTLSHAHALSFCPRARFIDEGPVTIMDRKFWCSAMTPTFCNWAYNRNETEIQKHWNRIEPDTEILITHGPPFGILDMDMLGVKLGCPHLYSKLSTLPALQVHAFGHIHASGGKAQEISKVLYLNAALCDDAYELANAPHVIEL